MCIGIQYFLGFVSSSGLANYKLDGLFCLDGMVILQVDLEFQFGQCPMGLRSLVRLHQACVNGIIFFVFDVRI